VARTASEEVRQEARVVTRRQKLIAAGLVLAAGLALSWPLRRTEPIISASVAVSSAEPIRAAHLPPMHRDQRLLQDSTAPNTAAASMVGPPASVDDPFAVVSTSAAPPEMSALAEPESAESAERIHVIHPGDSLDRLAKRYLGDEGRSLEIFDLNRGVLENPHLLPIGVELRIPARNAEWGVRNAE
jgi:nucleoid-associated protein YgaU